MLSPRVVTMLATLGILVAGTVIAKATAPGDVQARPVSERADGFSIVVTSTGTGIEAACEEGCGWRTVSATYPANQYDISSAGIRRAVGGAPDGGAAGFSFRVMTWAERGIRARCHHGCVWEAVSGNYPGGRYRVTEKGIAPAYGRVR